MTDFEIAEVEEILGYSFRKKELLVCALTHKSYANENGGESNGRLEYLGDSILNFIAAEKLYRTVSNDEGILTEIRKSLVSETPLAAVVREIGLLKYYRLGKGAKMSLSSFGDKPTSDIFEAVLGAIYLDGGLVKARKFVSDKLIKSGLHKVSV